MTSEELSEEMVKKRQRQMNHMLKIRKWQFIGFTVLGVFYMLVYRRFLHPKSITNSVLYHNALKFVNASSQVK